jgi:hypothetical protein
MKMYGTDGGIAPNNLNTRRLGTNILKRREQSKGGGYLECGLGRILKIIVNIRTLLYCEM